MKIRLIILLTCLSCTVMLRAQVEIVSNGVGSAYTLDVPAVFPLRNGVQVTFKANVVCSASPTIDVSGTGSIRIRKEGGTTDLDAGDIKAGQVVTLAYDGTYWQMLTNLGNTSSSSSPWTKSGAVIYPTTLTDYVGIGLNAPTAPLHIKGMNDPLEILLENTGGAFKTGLHVKTASHDWLMGMGGTQNFQIRDITAGQPRFDIDPYGNVGIGTTTPSITGGGGRFLTISSGTGAPASIDHADLELNGGSSDPWGIQNKIDFIARATDGSNYVTGGILMTNTSASTQEGQMHFYTKGAFIADRMMIDENGNVGIGTNTPSALLSVGSGFSGFEVNGSGNISKINNVYTSFPFSQGGVGTFLQNDGSGNLNWVAAPSLTSDWTKTGNNLYPTVLNNHVGIGTTSPTSFLEVSPSAPGATDLISSTTTGTGAAGYFEVNNPLSIYPAVRAFSNGAGSGSTIASYSTGDGRAGHFEISNSSNINAALDVVSNGTGPAVYGYQYGTGNGVKAEINNASSLSQALYASTTGTGMAGYFEANNSSSFGTAVRILSNTQNSKALDVNHTGAGAGSTDYGAYIRSTGAGTNNVGGYFQATGATNNYALQLGGSTSGTLSISPAAATATYSVKMPAAQGAALSVLQNDGVGNLSWTTSNSLIGSGTQNVLPKWNNLAGTTLGNSQISDNGTSVLIATNTNIQYGGSATRALAVSGNGSWGTFGAGLSVFNTLSVATAGNTLGSLGFGDGFSEYTAAIKGIRDGTGAAANDFPTALGFYTTLDGTNVLASERMRIDNAGNVGIGTVSPVAFLHINPTVTATSDVKSFQSGINYNGATPMANWYASYISTPTGTGAITNKYAFVTEAAAGNVGIGTIAPTSLFSVGTGATSPFQINSSGNIIKINNVTTSFPAAQGAANAILTNNGAGILTWNTISSLGGVTSVGATGVLTSTGGTTPNISLSGIVPIANGGTNNSTPYTAGSVIFSNGASLIEDNPKFFWDNTNNRLGIGNASPGQLLHLTDLTNGAKMRLEGPVGGASPINSAIEFFETSTFKASMGWASQTSQQYWFVYDGATTQNIVYKAGNLGINTQTPGAKLEVADANFFKVKMNRTGGVGYKSELAFTKSGTDRFSIGIDAGDNATQEFYIWDNIAGVERINVGSTGNVGIGTVAPTPNSILAIKDGHIQSQQTTAPTIVLGATTVVGNGGAPAASTFIANATDVAGNITLTTAGSGWTGIGAAVRVNFNKPYSTPPIIMLTPTNGNAAAAFNARKVFVVSNGSFFTINFGVVELATTTYTWSYYIIETQ